MKTHLGCIIGTSIMYTGNAFVSQLFVIPVMWKIVVSVILWVFAIIMIYLYAPADTEDVPVIAKRERKKRKVHICLKNFSGSFKIPALYYSQS